MKFYLFDQKPKFNQHLEVLKSKSVMPYSKSELREQKTSIKINTNKMIDEISLDFLFDYQIFPSSILTFKTQWQTENRVMQIGDTVVQQVFVPPISFLSQKIVFGARICELINQNTRKGFSYETLVGHAEKGISTFVLEQIDTEIYFTIHTFSKPGNMLTALLGPIFSIPYQRFCTQKALENVQSHIESQQ